MNDTLFSATHKTLVLALGLTAACSSAQAAPILRAAFDPSATTYGLAGATLGATTASNGDATLTNGSVVGGGGGPFVAPIYYDGGDSSVIRIDFATPVSAFGFDWLANNQNPTLSVFDSGNNLLESLTLNWTTFPRLNGIFPFGFIGIDVGSNSIAYATIDTPLNGSEIYLDNLIYQRAAVPEPASLSLFAIGALGATSLRRKRKKAA